MKLNSLSFQKEWIYHQPSADCPLFRPPGLMTRYGNIMHTHENSASLHVRFHFSNMKEAFMGYLTFYIIIFAILFVNNKLLCIKQ